MSELRTIKPIFKATSIELDIYSIASADAERELARIGNAAEVVRKLGTRHVRFGDEVSFLRWRLEQSRVLPSATLIRTFSAILESTFGE